MLLRPGGFVFLAVPDKRFTFDSERPETSCGHLIVDFENDNPVDSAEHHLDALIYHADKPEIIWNNIKRNRYDFVHHHHVFNSETFLDRIIRPLVRLKYLKFSVMRCETAEELYNEFVLIMRKEENLKRSGYLVKNRNCRVVVHPVRKLPHARLLTRSKSSAI